MNRTDAFIWVSLTLIIAVTAARADETYRWELDHNAVGYEVGTCVVEPDPAIPYLCMGGTAMCADVDTLPGPRCHTVWAIAHDGERIPAVNGPHCHEAGVSCLCDLDLNGAVGLSDLIMAWGNPALVQVCIGELGNACQ